MDGQEFRFRPICDHLEAPLLPPSRVLVTNIHQYADWMRLIHSFGSVNYSGASADAVSPFGRRPRDTAAVQRLKRVWDRETGRAITRQWQAMSSSID